MSAGYSLAPFIKARPWLHKLILPIAQVYGNATGYRKLGLRYALLPDTAGPGQLGFWSLFWHWGRLIEDGTG